MRVNFAEDYGDDARQIIAAAQDEGHVKIRKRLATRAEIRDFLQAAFELHLSGTREGLEYDLEWNPEKAVRGYVLPEIGW